MRNLHQPQRMKLRHQPPHKQIIYRNQYAPLSFQRPITSATQNDQIEPQKNLILTYNQRMLHLIVIEFFLDLNASY